LVALGGSANVGATYQKVDTAVAAAKTSDDQRNPARAPAIGRQQSGQQPAGWCGGFGRRLAMERKTPEMQERGGNGATRAAMETGTTEMAVGTAGGGQRQGGGRGNPV
jgi:hypothetical protein